MVRLFFLLFLTNAAASGRKEYSMEKKHTAIIYTHDQTDPETGRMKKTYADWLARVLLWLEDEQTTAQILINDPSPARSPHSPALNDLFRLVRTGHYDRVLIGNYDDLSDKTVGAAVLIQLLEAFGVEVLVWQSSLAQDKAIDEARKRIQVKV